VEIRSSGTWNSGRSIQLTPKASLGAEQLFKWIEAAVRAQVDLRLENDCSRRKQRRFFLLFRLMIPVSARRPIGSALVSQQPDECNSFLLLSTIRLIINTLVRPPAGIFSLVDS